MKKRTSFIKHKGREIVFLDYSNIKSKEEYVEAMEETDRQIFPHGTDPKDNLTLIDVTGSIMCVEVMSRASKLRAKVGGKDLLVAIVGITSMLNRIMAKAFSNNFYFVNSIEKAKDWLVEKAVERDQKNEA